MRAIVVRWACTIRMATYSANSAVGLLPAALQGIDIDGFDVIAVYEAAIAAVARARRGDGPSLLVTESYRIEGHYAGEPEWIVHAFRRPDPALHRGGSLRRERAGHDPTLVLEARERRRDLASEVAQAPRRRERPGGRGASPNGL